MVKAPHEFVEGICNANVCGECDEPFDDPAHRSKPIRNHNKDSEIPNHLWVLTANFVADLRKGPDGLSEEDRVIYNAYISEVLERHYELHPE